MTKSIVTALVATSLLLSQPASAQQETVVAFAKGASSQTLKGSIKGDQDHNYVVDARAGQTLTVDFKPTNASAYFNVTAPGADIGDVHRLDLRQPLFRAADGEWPACGAGLSDAERGAAQ